MASKNVQPWGTTNVRSRISLYKEPTFITCAVLLRYALMTLKRFETKTESNLAIRGYVLDNQMLSR